MGVGGQTDGERRQREEKRGLSPHRATERERLRAQFEGSDIDRGVYKRTRIIRQPRKAIGLTKKPKKKGGEAEKSTGWIQEKWFAGRKGGKDVGCG